MDLSCSLLVEYDDSVHPDRFCIHMSLETMQKLAVKSGSFVEIIANSKMVVCTAKGFDCSGNKIIMNRFMRHNLRVLLGDPVMVRPCRNLELCKTVHIALIYSESIKGLNRDICKDLLNKFFEKRPIVLCNGNKFIVQQGMRDIEFSVTNIEPGPYSVIEPFKYTKINFLTNIQREKIGESILSNIAYEDIGGYSNQLRKLRELEFPLKFPSLFRHLKVANPYVIMHGPQGNGKLLMAKAFANETNAHFVLLEESIVNDSESVYVAIDRIQKKLNEAKEYSTSVICFDGLHKIAPKLMTVDAEEYKFFIKEFIKMLKQFEQERGHVTIIIGITNVLSQVNNGVLHSFYNTNNDKDISFDYPDFFERHKIIKIHTRNVKLSDDFDFNQVLLNTDSYTGAQLATLCKKAANLAVSKKIEESIGIDDEEVEETALFLNTAISHIDFLDLLVKPTVEGS